MKSIFVVFIALAIACPSQALFFDTISNLIGSASNTISNTITTVQTGINTATLAGQFLWDNAFGPAYEQFLALGADFIDNYFGSLLNGKRDEELRLQLSVVQNLFQTQAAEILSQFKQLFVAFIEDTKSTVVNSILPLVLGQVTINDLIGTVLNKAKALIQQVIQFASQNFNNALQNLGSEFVQLAQTLQQQFQNLATQFNQELNAIASGIINGFNGALMVLQNEINHLKLYFEQQIQSFLNEVNKILANSLLGLLFGVTNVNNIFDSLLALGQKYLIESVQYVIQYGLQNINTVASAFKPILTQTVNLVMQQLSTLGITMPTLQLGPVITNLISQVILP